MKIGRVLFVAPRYSFTDYGFGCVRYRGQIIGVWLNFGHRLYRLTWK